MIYCPPNKTCEFKLRFEEDFKLFIFTGDYNIDIIKPVTKNWINKCTDLGLKQLISSPMRTTANSKSIIDHFYVNEINNSSHQFNDKQNYHNSSSESLTYRAYNWIQYYLFV
jgi:hypothetical protein